MSRRFGGGRRSGGLRCGLGGGFRRRFAVEGEKLGLIALNGVEESVVVGGAVGGDLPEQKVDVARGGGYLSFRGVLGGESGVVALDGGASWRGNDRAGGNVQGHVGFDFERSAKFDGRSSRAWGLLCGRIGQA